MGKYTDEQRDAILATAHDAIELADAALATRKDPGDPDVFSNVIRLTPKPAAAEPEPPRTRYTDSVVQRLIGELAADTSAQLDEFREYVGGELCELLTETFNNTADALDELREDMRGLRSKFIEGDIERLMTEQAAQRTEIDKLRQAVEMLGNELAALRDDVASAERSAKVFSLRGAS